MSHSSPPHKRQKIAQTDEEPPASCPFSLLSDDVLDKLFSFVGPGYYRYLGGTCKRFRDVYLNERSNRTKDTFWRNVTASVSCAELRLKDQEWLGRTREEKQAVIATIGSKAAELGKVEVLAWAHGNGIILNKKMFRKAGRNGHVNVLEWAHSNNLDWHGCNLVYRAAANGHVNVLDFVLDKHPSVFDDRRDFTNRACQFGRIDVLEWFKQKQLLPDNGNVINGMYLAAAHGHVAVLDWLCGEGYEPTSRVMNEAAYDGHVDVLQWARDRGIHFSTSNCINAAARGHLNALQWLRENGCPWDSRVISNAARNGHDHVVDWARENGCPEP